MSEVISNPFSTGGGGHDFELRVIVNYMISLLKRNMPVGLNRGTTDKLRFQSRQKGILFDDLQITTSDRNLHFNLYLQIKHSLTIGKNEVFKKVLKEAWETYNSVGGWQFVKEHDRIGIVMGTLTLDAHDHLLPILDWAKSALSVDEFRNKVYTKHFSHSNKVTYYEIFYSNLSEITGESIKDEALWDFLRHFVILVFDYGSEGSKDAVYNWNALLEIVENGSSSLALQLYNSLIAEASRLAPIAASINYLTLKARIDPCLILSTPTNCLNDISRLSRHSQRVLAAIRTDLDGRITLPRDEIISQIEDSIPNSEFVFVIGKPGVGKSAILKSFACRNEVDSQVIVLRAEDLNFPNLESWMQSFGLNNQFTDILAALLSPNLNCILVDGIDKILGYSSLNCMTDVITEITSFNQQLTKQNNSSSNQFKVIFSCRAEEYPAIYTELSDLLGGSLTNKISSINIDPFSDSEMHFIKEFFPELNLIFENSNLTDLLKVPLYLDIITKQHLYNSDNNVREKVTEISFLDTFWRLVIERNQGARLGKGSPLSRNNTVLDISEHLLTERKNFTNVSLYDPLTIEGLIEDQILLLEDDNLRFRHDIIEDWCLFKILRREKDRLFGFLTLHSTARLLDRSFQLYIESELHIFNRDSLLPTIRVLDELSTTHPRWKTFFWKVVLESPKLSSFLTEFDDLLNDNNFKFFSELLKVLRTQFTDKDPNIALLNPSEDQLLDLRIPKVQYWIRILPTLTSKLSDKAISDIPGPLLLEFSKIARIWIQTKFNPFHRRELSELAFRFAFSLDDSVFYDSHYKTIEKDLLIASLLGADSNPSQVEKVLRFWLSHSENTSQSIFYRISEHILELEYCSTLAICLPDLLADITKHLLIAPVEVYDSTLDIFGIKDVFSCVPPTPFKGPFLLLLTTHTAIGLDLVLQLTDHSTDCWIESRTLRRSPSLPPLPQIIYFDGDNRKFWGDDSVWRWFRYPSWASNSLAAALAALELWLTSKLETEEYDPRGHFEYLIKNTKSVAILAILTSITIRFPERCIDVMQPILLHSGFWLFDFKRRFADLENQSAVQMFAPYTSIFDTQILTKIAGEPHRLQDLENFILLLMMNNAKYKDSFLPIINNFPNNLPFTHTSQLDDDTFTQELRLNVKMLVFRTNIDNIRLVPQPNGTYLIEYIDVPDDIQSSSETAIAGQHFINLASQLVLWATTDSDKQTILTPYEALQLAYSLENNQQFDSSLPKLVFLRHQAIAAVASNLIINHMDFLDNTPALPWCRSQLLQYAFFKQTPDDALGELSTSENSHHWDRSSAKAMPFLYVHNLSDSEVQDAIFSCLLTKNYEIRRFTITSIKNLTSYFPEFVYQCFQLLLIASIKSNDFKPLPQKTLTKLKSLLDDISIDGSDKTPEILQLINPDNCDSYGLAHAFLIFDTENTNQFNNHLLALYDSFLTLIRKLHSSISTSKFSSYTRDSFLHYTDEYFFRLTFPLFKLFNSDTIYSDFIYPLVLTWSEYPDLTNTFLKQYILYTLKNKANNSQFTAHWTAITNLILSTPPTTLKSSVSIYHTLIFSPDYFTFKEYSWDVLPLLDGSITLWCELLGHLPNYYSVLLKTLSIFAIDIIPSYGLKWLSICSENAANPSALYTEDNIYHLSNLLLKTYNKNKNNLLSSPYLSIYNHFIDILVEHGNQIGIYLQAQTS